MASNILPGVTFIFPIFNSDPHNSLTCLNSISQLNYPKTKIEVIVVDNGSTNTTPQLIHKHFPKAKLLTLSHNMGFSRAINIGLKVARNPLIYITNDDVIFEHSNLLQLANFLTTHPTVKIVGGKIISSHNPTVFLSAGHTLNPWTGLIYPSAHRDTIAYPNWVQGCALLAHASFLKQINYLDEAYYMYFEDVQLCFTARKLGFLVAYYPYALVWHAESYSLNKHPYRKLYHWYMSKLIFTLRNYDLIHQLSIFSFQTLIILPTRLVLLQFSHIKAFFSTLYSYALYKAF